MRKSGSGDGSPGHERLVKRRQLSNELPDRPAVAHDMVGVQQQDVVLLRKLQQIGANQWSGLEIKHMAAVLNRHPPYRRFLSVSRYVSEVRNRNVDLYFVGDHLNGQVVFHDESGAQYLVPPNNFIQRALRGTQHPAAPLNRTARGML